MAAAEGAGLGGGAGGGELNLESGVGAPRCPRTQKRGRLTEGREWESSGA